MSNESQKKDGLCVVNGRIHIYGKFVAYNVHNEEVDIRIKVPFDLSKPNCREKLKLLLDLYQKTVIMKRGIPNL